MSVLDNLDCDLLSALEDLSKTANSNRAARSTVLRFRLPFGVTAAYRCSSSTYSTPRSFRWSRNTTRNDIGMSARLVRQLRVKPINPRHA